jgi:GTP-binding protein LepA
VRQISFADTTFTDPTRIRNFCIIAHIDHGKSTLADRMLQLTGVVDGAGDARAVPRPHGHRARARHHHQGAERALPWSDGRGTFVLHLIDTPGHVDFTYEVSRALDACEGAILLVDAAQGIEAQTLANLYLALENDLQIIPVSTRSTCRPPIPTSTPQRSRTSSAASPTTCCGSRARPGMGSRSCSTHRRRSPAPVGRRRRARRAR